MLCTRSATKDVVTHMNKALRNSISAIGMIAAFALVIGFGTRAGTSLPDHAIFLVNSQDKTYATPPCIINGTTSSSYVENVAAVIKGTEEVQYEPFVSAMTKSEVRKLGFRGDRACANADGFLFFVPTIYSLLGWKKQRVLADGTVLW